MRGEGNYLSQQTQTEVAACFTRFSGNSENDTFLGLQVGSRLEERLEAKAELASGLVLTLLGIALLINQATGNHLL